MPSACSDMRHGGSEMTFWIEELVVEFLTIEKEMGYPNFEGNQPSYKWYCFNIFLSF